jgi:hypothetical protein
VVHHVADGWPAFLRVLALRMRLCLFSSWHLRPVRG